MCVCVCGGWGEYAERILGGDALEGLAPPDLGVAHHLLPPLFSTGRDA